MSYLLCIVGGVIVGGAAVYAAISFGFLRAYLIGK